ncbi:hypothetical protein KY289_019885 [Solanum tuberosum]|nr:hypothetical protein KY289_019885 [Solanum tuberosum]
MDAFNSPNPQMVVDVNYKLRSWWIDIKKDREREIRQLLGGLTYLIFVIPNLHLIRALLEFWDPVRMVFKFMDFDLAPTIEEISDLGWIHFDFLYSRFGRDVSYYSFIDEFECSVEEWETDRLNAFAIALLGSLVFPKIRGKIDTRLGYVVRDLAQREGEPRKTLVPMILAEIMRSLLACVDGRMFFEGCNLFLQLWAIEHFYLRSDVIFLTELESYRIQWKLHWLSTPHAIVRGDDRYFIELISLKGVQPYTPLRVLRQFGQTQALCTREYYIWILKEVKDREVSGEGYYGLTDERENIWARNTMVYHTRSKEALPSLSNKNHKEKRKATNEKVMSKTIEKKHPSDELVSSLKKKIKELEEEVSDMRGPSYLTPSLSSPPLQASQYQTLLHQVPWYCAPLQMPPYQIPPSQKPPLPYQKPNYPVQNIKTLTQKHIRKNLFNVEKRPIKIYTPLTEPMDKFYEKLRIVGHIAPVSEIRMNTRGRWIETSKVCAYHSGMKRHTIEECRDLKDKIQQLIDTKIICLEDFAPKKSQQKTC